MSANDTPPNPATTSPASSVPDSICGYPVIAGLASSQANESDFLGPSFQAKGPGDRSVVLKPLDRDCLLPSGLHPSIRERLARVRELALGSVANLYGVEREPRAAEKNGTAPNQAWLIWEYVRGQTLEAFAADPACTERRLAVVARELVLVVEALHRQGIVHGAIRPNNVIVDSQSGVRLTHVSPLLYTDPSDDVWGVLHTMEQVIAALPIVPAQSTPLGELVAETLASLSPASGPAPSAEAMFRQFATRLNAIIDARENSDAPLPAAEAVEERAPRRRSLAGAAIVLVLGAAIGYGTWWILQQPAGGGPGWLQSVKNVLK